MKSNKSDYPLLEFNPKLPRLSNSEKAVLKLLVEAGRLIVPIYLEQEKDAAKVDRKEIEEAGKKDATILSPYTVVEKVNGKIIAIPYHIKYIKFLEPISEKLNQAANITDNKEFGKALKVQAEALLSGSYNQVAIAWLKTKPYIFDISIGPLQHFDNKLFFSKASYHAWIGIVEREGTERFNNYKAIVLRVRRRALVPKERIDNLDKVKAKVLDVVLFSGLMARTKFVGINLPMDAKLVEEYGSEVTLFNQPNDLRVKEMILPAFNQIFSTGFKQGFSKEDLRSGYLRNVALHELAHSFLYYRNATINLEEFFPVIHELAATVLGLIMAGSLLLKDRITTKQLESMIVAFISRSFFLKEKSNNVSMSNYILGSATFINFMLESGAIKRSKGLFYPNLTKIFVSLHDLLHILESLLANGLRKDAESFVKKYQHSFA